MAHEVRGVVARAKKEPVTVETITVPDPGPGEALVRVKACGVCHTDLHYREGGINDDFPFLLGHEAAGVVEGVGEGVTGVAPGDYVVIAWRAPCGQCRSCRRGRPWYCFNSANATQKMTLGGTPLSPALGIGAFAELTLVAAGQCVKVDPRARPEAAGVVSAVGEGVTNVAVGDYVILNWRAVCGQCRACVKGEPQYCFDTHNATQKMTLEDGTELSPALGIGAFLEKTLVAAGQCTKVDARAPATARRSTPARSAAATRWR